MIFRVLRSPFFADHCCLFLLSVAAVQMAAGCKSRIFDSDIKQDRESVPKGHPTFPELESCLEKRRSGEAEFVTPQSLDKAYNPSESSLGLNNFLLQYLSSRSKLPGKGSLAVDVHRFEPRFKGSIRFHPGFTELVQRHGVDPKWYLCVDILSSRIVSLSRLIKSYPQTMRIFGYEVNYDEQGNLNWIEFPASAQSIQSSRQQFNRFLKEKSIEPLAVSFVEGFEDPFSSLNRPLLQAYADAKVMVAPNGYLFAHDLTAHVSQAFWPKSMLEAWKSIPKFFLSSRRAYSKVHSYFNFLVQNFLHRNPKEVLISQLDFTAARLTSVMKQLSTDPEPERVGKSIWAVMLSLYLYSRQELNSSLKNGYSHFLQILDVEKSSYNEWSGEREETPVIDALMNVFSREVVPADYLYSTLFVHFESSHRMKQFFSNATGSFEERFKEQPEFLDADKLRDLNSYLKLSPAEMGQDLIDRRIELEQNAAEFLK